MTVTGQQFLNHSAMPQFFFIAPPPMTFCVTRASSLESAISSASELHSHFLSLPQHRDDFHPPAMEGRKSFFVATTMFETAET
jgi:hypothetical protein